jgi:hypothetical protein
VRARTSESDALAASAERLRAEVAAQSAALLGGDEAGRAAARSSSGWTCSPAARRCRDRGCGSCSPTRPPRRTRSTPLRAAAPRTPPGISDRNLQDLVNALWAAGAEAVDVNGQRLTALTAIRSAGEAVLVDFRPLSPAVRRAGVGDAADLQVELLDGPTGRRLTTVRLALRLGASRSSGWTGSGCPAQGCPSCGPVGSPPAAGS